MYAWSAVKVSASGGSAGGYGKYECYVTKTNDRYIGQLVFMSRGQKKYYIYECNEADFSKYFGECLFDNEIRAMPLMGIAKDQQLKKFIEYLDKYRQCVIFLSASTYQKSPIKKMFTEVIL